MGANVSRLISGAADGSVCIWDVRAGLNTKPVIFIQAYTNSVGSVALHGDSMLAASLEEGASMWDLRGTTPAPLDSISFVDKPANAERVLSSRTPIEHTVDGTSLADRDSLFGPAGAPTLKASAGTQKAWELPLQPCDGFTVQDTFNVDDLTFEA